MKRWLIFILFLLPLALGAQVTVVQGPPKLPLSAGGGGGGPAATLDWLLNGDTTDASGNGNNGTATSLGAYSVDEQGRATHAATFDGNLSRVDGSTSVGNITTQDATWSVWFQWTGGTWTANPVILSKGQFTVSGYYIAAVNTTDGTTAKIQFISNQSSADQIVESTTTALTESGGTSGWYNVVVTRSSGTVKIYVNGVDVTQASPPSITNPASDTSDTFRVGMYSSGASNKFTGSIAEVSLWDGVALSSAQVAANYTAGSK